MPSLLLLQERLAAYEKKVKKAVTADDLARHRPGTSLNIAAANRFIDAAIPDLTAEQKQAIRNLGKRDSREDRAATGAGDSSSKRSRKSIDSSGKQQQQQGGKSSEAAGAGADSDADSDEQQRQQQCVGVEGSSKAAAAAEAEAADFLREVLAR